MKKSLITIALIGIVGIGFSGCMSNKVVQPLQVKTNKTQTIHAELKYNDFLSNQPISQEELKSNLVDNFDSSRIYRQIEYYKCSKYKYCKVKGRKVELKNDTINIYYVRGMGYKLGMRKNQVEAKDIFNINSKEAVRSLGLIEIPLNIKGDKNTFVIDTQFPATFKNVDYSGGMTNHVPLTTTANMQKDSLQSFQTLKNITIARHQELSGEVNSKYDNVSIKANFKRLLNHFGVAGIGYRTYINSLNRDYFRSLSKRDPLVITYKNRLYPVKFNIYPYRGGSKVKYIIEVAYTLNPNGTTNITKQDLENIKAEFAKIVND